MKAIIIMTIMLLNGNGNTVDVEVLRVPSLEYCQQYADLRATERMKITCDRFGGTVSK